MASPTNILIYTLRTVWVLLCNLICIPSYLAWMVLFLPVYLSSPLIYWQIEEVMFSWMLSIVSCWSWSAGYNIVESGESLDNLKSKRLLLLPNHQSTADVPLLMSIFTARIGLTNKLMWIMDRVFKFTNFGVISWMHDDFFIRSGKAGRELTLVELKDHLVDVFLKKQRQYLVLFPEGGFLRKRKAVSHEFAKKKDLPLLEHVTLPRTGALDVVMKVLGPDSQLEEANKIERIVDMTIAYPEGKPLDLQSIILGWRPPCNTHVHYRSWDVKELPKTSEELFNWMVNLYQQKEQMLDEYYKTGEFPYKKFEDRSKQENIPMTVTHDPLRFLTLHIFFFVSALMFIKIFMSITTIITTVFSI